MAPSVFSCPGSRSDWQRRPPVWLAVGLLIASSAVAGNDGISEGDVSKQSHMLRSGDVQEWETFPATRLPKQLVLQLPTPANSSSATIALSADNVKQTWKVMANGTEIGRLPRDENPIRSYWTIPEELLSGDELTVAVEPGHDGNKNSDDIRISNIRILPGTANEVLQECRVRVTVCRTDNQSLPCRLTILNENGELQTTGTLSSGSLAVRPGTVFTSSGEAEILLPAGRYTIFAGHGFEYSLEQKEIRLTAGDVRTVRFKLQQQVDSDGWMSVDPHVHTLTHSGHGDADVRERMITLAAEGIDVAVATDHNVHIDYAPHVLEAQLDQHINSIVGNEYTTPVGHFNIFPVDPKTVPPNHKQKSWNAAFTELAKTVKPQVIILNHARDIHSGFRPFAPSNHISLSGENLLSQSVGYNAMEVVNSGATQSDPLQLLRDWMGLLNAGYSVAAAGTSDSHDVARHFVGQARTYVPVQENTSPEEAVCSAFQTMQTRVSYGLMTTLQTAVDEEQVRCRVMIHSPGWIQADRWLLFANGRQVAERPTPQPLRNDRGGFLIEDELTLPNPTVDTCYIAVATGPGIEAPYWRTALPYQPRSVSTRTIVMGSSAPNFVDIDGQNGWTSPRHLAERLWTEADDDFAAAIQTAATIPGDYAVAVQLTAAARRAGMTFEDPRLLEVANNSPPEMRSGIIDYRLAWRESRIQQLQSEN